MTPLARMIIQHKLHPNPKNTIFPAADGSYIWTREQEDWWLYAVIHAHYFDVTDVRREGLIKLVYDKMMAGWKQDERFDPTLAFLPAPMTWIEYTIPMPEEVKEQLIEKDGDVTTVHLLFQKKPSAKSRQWPETDDNTASLHTLMVARIGWQHFVWEDLTSADNLVLRGNPRFTWHDKSTMESSHFLVYAMLSIINSPAVFQRDYYKPHRAVAREAKTKGFGEVRGWHKIRLSITREVSDAAGESNITGERCLHFVRMFARWRLGRLEYVRDHWRGNPEHGVSLASYKVKP